MDFKPLTKPRAGIHFWVWRLMFHFNWAKDWTWAQDVEGIRRTELFSFCLVQKNGETGCLNAISLTVLPLKIMVGLGA